MHVVVSLFLPLSSPARTHTHRCSLPRLPLSSESNHESTPSTRWKEEWIMLGNDSRVVLRCVVMFSLVMVLVMVVSNPETVLSTWPFDAGQVTQPNMPTSPVLKRKCMPKVMRKRGIEMLRVEKKRSFRRTLGVARGCSVCPLANVYVVRGCSERTKRSPSSAFNPYIICRNAVLCCFRFSLKFVSCVV